MAERRGSPPIGTVEHKWTVIRLALSGCERALENRQVTSRTHDRGAPIRRVHSSRPSFEQHEGEPSETLSEEVSIAARQAVRDDGIAPARHRHDRGRGPRW